MIARVWKGETWPDAAEAFLQHELRYGMKETGSAAGNRGSYLLRRTSGDRVEYVHITFWENLEAVKRYAGEDYERSVYQEGPQYESQDKDILIELSESAEHYEIVATSNTGEANES